MKRPRIDPAIGVIGFVVVGTLLIWAIADAAGPGRPSARVALLSVAAPLAGAVVVAWLIGGRREE